MTTHEIHESVVYNAVRAMFPDAEFTVENDDEPFLVIKTNLMFCGDTGEMLIGAVNPANLVNPVVYDVTARYNVQYEIEYGDDGPSRVGVQVVKASSEEEAMSIFDLYYAEAIEQVQVDREANIVLHDARYPDGEPIPARPVKKVTATFAWPTGSR